MIMKSQCSPQETLPTNYMVACSTTVSEAGVVLSVVATGECFSPYIGPRSSPIAMATDKDDDNSL